MFTGLIEATAEVLRRTDQGLTVSRPSSFTDVKFGSSIAVSGACLTVVGLTKKEMRFDVVPETWSKTKLGDLRIGDKVNLERALRADGRFEGHVVQGHIEGVGVVVSVSSSIPRPLPPPEQGELKKRFVGSNLLTFARSMRKDPTDAEEVLWQCLRNHQINGLLFRRQHPLGGRVLDFYCHELKLGVELDGSIHDEKHQKKEDKIRDTYLMDEFGIRMLRFENKEVLEDVDAVLAKISSPSPPTGAPSPRGGGGTGERENPSIELTLKLPSSLLPFVLPKGSITPDGVSLTVASIEKDVVTVALVPHTLKETTLGSLKEGNRVNIGTDVLIRAVLQRANGGM